MKKKTTKEKIKTYDRRATYKMYPTKEQEALLFKRLYLERWLHNALLEQRKTVYQSSGKSFSYSDQCKEITKLRADDPRFKNVNAQSLQKTADRIDKAYDNAFARIARGEKAGFPRFKSQNRCKSFSYKSHGDGYRITHDKSTKKRKMRNGNIHMTGIGTIPIRGSSQHEGEHTVTDIIYKAGGWEVSTVIRMTNKPKRNSGDKVAGFDWGTEHFATLAFEDGTHKEIPNPRNGRKAKKKIADAQTSMNKKEKGSKNREKAKIKFGKAHKRLKNQRTDFLHQTSSELIKTYGLLSAEQLDIKAMTEAGENARERGLNREVLDTAPASFYAMLDYKAEEAGSIFTCIETKKWLPTQACSCCGRMVWKDLSVREHKCPYCGLVLKRDENSSRVCLNVVTLGRPCSREPTVCLEAKSNPTLAAPKQESPPILEYTNSLNEFV